ncbi:MAG: hypothetical protein ABSF83_12715 [Nitrososphaerales archaeon]|jgi:hypothetical protein
MEPVTWIDRITVGTNPWFMANRKQDEDDPLQAVLLYLKDATECLGQGLVVKGALSASCAAECLATMGQLQYARRLYSESARIYLVNSESALATSVRESLWSLQEAYEYFLLAEDWQEARQAHDRLVHLSKRVDPNFGDRGTVESPRSEAAPLPGAARKQALPLDSSTGVAESIEQFLLLRKSSAGPIGKPVPRPAAARTDKRRRQIPDEKSIISQLG